MNLRASIKPCTVSERASLSHISAGLSNLIKTGFNWPDPINLTHFTPETYLTFNSFGCITTKMGTESWIRAVVTKYLCYVLDEEHER